MKYYVIIKFIISNLYQNALRLAVIQQADNFDASTTAIVMYSFGRMQAQSCLEDAGFHETLMVCRG